MILWLALALAGEHDAAAPAQPVAGGLTIPAGPPIEVVAAAGDDLGALLSTLPAGSRLRLSAGRYRGPLLIDRPLEVAGADGVHIDGGGTGSVVVVAAPDVWIHDLHVTGSGDQRQQNDAGVVVAGDRFRIERVTVDHSYLGIDVRRASDGTLIDCAIAGDATAALGLRGDGIRLWEAYRNHVEGNTLSDVRDLVVWYSGDNVIRGNTVTGSRYGTHLMHAFGNTIESNRYDSDIVGVFVMYSADVVLRGNTVLRADGEAGVGFGFKESDAVTVIDNVLVDNTTGIYLDTTPHRIDGHADFHGNLIGGCDVGLRLHGPSPRARFEGNTFEANRLAAAVDGRFQEGRPAFEGNHWSDYAGYDLDGDGAGDLPFQARSATGALVERRPELAWFAGTPAVSLLELFASAFPMFAPPPVLTDARPAVGGLP